MQSLIYHVCCLSHVSRRDFPGSVLFHFPDKEREEHSQYGLVNSTVTWAWILRVAKQAKSTRVSKVQPLGVSRNVCRTVFLLKLWVKLLFVGADRTEQTFAVTSLRWDRMSSIEYWMASLFWGFGERSRSDSHTQNPVKQCWMNYTWCSLFFLRPCGSVLSLYPKPVVINESWRIIMNQS